MNELTSFLDTQGFTKAAKIDTLKVTLSPVKHEDDNVDIPSPDKRYYWDGKVFGLHVSNVEWEASVWDTLIALLTKNKAKIEVLYLGNTDREGLSVASFPALHYLNLFANHRIKTLTLKDCPQLASLRTYGCDVLQKIELRGTFLKLEKLDVSYCPSLDELIFPTHFPKLRFLHAIETKLENDYITLGGYFDGELREKISVVRRQNSITTLLKPLEQEIDVLLSENINYDEFGNIIFLDLGHLGLSKLPESLFKIQTLEHLCLGSYYPQELNEFTNVTYVASKYSKEYPNRNNKFISESLKNLAQFENIKSLFLNSIGLNNLDFLKGISALVSLDISGNTSLINFSSLLNLKELKLFHASSIPSLTNENLKLPKHTINLSLSNCHLESMVFLNDLENPQIVFLDGNKIETKELIDFIWSEGKLLEKNFNFITNTIPIYKGIYIQNNPIDEGFLRLFDETDNIKKTELIINYIKNYFKEDEEIKVKFIKLILIGNTRAGKTTLYDIITQNTPAKSDEPSTHGVNIFQIDEEKEEERFIIKGYDFGGQDYYHSTHWAYFSTNNTVYSLVFRSDWEDKFYIHDNELTYPLDYWLDSIRKISRIENNASTIDDIHVQLIQNKYGEAIQDLNVKSTKESFKELNIVYYKDNEHNLKDILKGSDSGYREKFLQNLRGKAQIRGIQKKQLEFIKFLKEKTDLGILPRKIVFEYNEKLEWIEAALKNAHNTYDIIDLKGNKNASEYQFLKDYIITDISKFNNYIFLILERGGDAYFTEDDARDKIENQPTIEFQKKGLVSFLADVNYLKFVIEFIQLYKIAFKLPNENGKYLAPAFLSEKLSKPEELFIKTFQKPIFEYRFRAFYHGNIFTEIVLEFIKELLKENKWMYLLKKNHVFLHDKNETRFLYVNFGLDKKENFPILKIYNHSLYGVSDTFIEKTHKNLDKIMNFPIFPDNIESESEEEKRRIEEEFEIKLKDFTIEKIVYNKYKEALGFKELICQKNMSENNKDSQSIYYQSKFFRKGDYKLFLPKHKQIKYPMKKIFISYSKFDEKYKEELKSHLITLKRRDLIETFDDRDIESGDKFDHVIKQKIKDCDVFICLISVNFLNVDYIIEQEIPLAISEGKTVLPIVIKPCDWYEMPLFKGIEDKSLNLGAFNAHDKATILTLRPEYKGKRDEQGNKQIKEFTETERDFMWFQVVEEIKKIIARTT
ncbi:TIR domain-containing protein [Runella sp. SP2]|uniref:TIR domain-containing protein n=1 Tax=Runella sp. SP2 TaxID=2268026 RepID=UPI000F0738EB|nr:TIR domain-containing protein [Runella sp. SP2]AYQ33154.1 TIR domain-containing protein [Runella sp. SP2]